MKHHFGKMLSVLLAVTALCICFPVQAMADIGPKPSVRVEFNCDWEGDFYVTLLSHQKSTGPYSYEFTEDIPPEYMLKGDDAAQVAEAWAAMKNYVDSDGFCFIGFMEKCSRESGFSWTYYPPNSFKVLVYHPADKSFTVSDIYGKYAFDSYYELSMVQGSAILQKSYDFTWEILSLIARIAMTIILEVLLTFAFGIKDKKMLGIIVCGNIITQLALNIFLNIINYQNGSLAFTFYYILAEIGIIIAESVIYTTAQKKYRCDVAKGRLIGYAAVSNTVSFAAGLYIAHLIPGIF